MKKEGKKSTGRIKVWSMRNAILAVAILIIFQALISPKTQEVVNNDSEILEELHQIKSGLIEYGKDINEMREYLLLEPKTYQIFKKEDLGIKEEEDVTDQINNFTKTLGENYSLQKQQKAAEDKINNLKKNQDFYKEVRNIGLWPASTLGKTDKTIAYKFYEGKNAIAQLILDKESGIFKMQSVIGTEEIKYSEEKTLEQSTLEYLRSKKVIITEMKIKLEQQKVEVKKLWGNEELKKVLSGNLLQANLNPAETEKGWEYGIQNADSQPLLIITINRTNGNFELRDQKYETIELLTPPLLESLKTLDGETDRIKNIETKKKEVEELINSNEFQENLKENNLKVAEAREEGNQTHYDLKNIEDEKIVGSIILEKETGKITFNNPLESVKKND